MVSSSQRPLPDNTQHSQQTDIHAPGGIRTHDLSRRAAVDPRLRPRGYWDRLCAGYPHDPVNERCADLECRMVCFPGSSDESQERSGKEWVLDEAAEACEIKWARPLEILHTAASCGHSRKGPQNNRDPSFHPRVNVKAFLPEIFTPWQYFVPRNSLPPSVCLSP